MGSRLTTVDLMILMTILKIPVGNKALKYINEVMM